MSKDRLLQSSDTDFIKDYSPSDLCIVKKDVFFCDGAEDSGHPRIYLKFGLEDKMINCPYCNKLFCRASTEQ